MIEIKDCSSADDIAKLRRDYLATLSAPFDGMWETFAGMGRQLEFHFKGKLAGFFSLNDEGQILQFYVAEPFHTAADEHFRSAVARDDVTGAMVSTADPLFLSLCLDAHKSLKVHTYLYQDQHHPEPVFAKRENLSLDIVGLDELEEIAGLQRTSLEEDPGVWLIGYLEQLIGRGELYALRLEGEILGTGEARVSQSQLPFVDLGVITMRAHRRRGVAAHILGRLKQLCYDRELVPICSTTAQNTASRRAIEKAGFVSINRLLQIIF